MTFVMFFYEQGTAKFKRFPSLEALELEAGKFLFYHKDETEDNYIDIIVEGEPKYIYPHYQEVV